MQTNYPLLDEHFKEKKRHKWILLYSCGMFILGICYVVINVANLFLSGDRSEWYFIIGINSILLLLMATAYVCDIYNIHKNMVIMYENFKNSKTNHEREYFYYILLGYVLIHSHKTSLLLEKYYKDKR